MIGLLRCLGWPAVALILFVMLIPIWAWEKPTSATPYVAADLHSGESGFVLTLYPLDGGPKTTIPLPGLPRNFAVIGYSSSARAIYIQTKDSNGVPDGIAKIEFKPVRLATVRGSSGVSGVWHLSDSQHSAKILISGLSRTGNRPLQCGVFEVDTSSGSFRPLRVSEYPQSGGADGEWGAISVEGLRMLSYQGHELDVLDLKNGGSYSLGTGFTQSNWSPNGRWVAAWGAGRIVVIDADHPSRRKDLGKCCDGGVHWSPDSKYLLLSKQEFRCTLSLFFASLEVLDVETGKRTVIKSSRCNTGGWIGWLDPGVAAE